MLGEVEPVFVDIARHVARFERLIITCFDDAHRQWVHSQLVRAAVPENRVHLYVVPSNDTWVRDHGPITVVGPRGPVLLDFTFNGWGNKFNAGLDDLITRRRNNFV